MLDITENNTVYHIMFMNVCGCLYELKMDWISNSLQWLLLGEEE